MAITTAVQVCNIGLRRLGEPNITSLDSPTTPTEEILADIYEIERDLLMAGPAIEDVGPHNWTFAKRHIQLDLGAGFETNEGTEYTITAITQATPTKVTLSATPGFDSNFNVLIYDVVGMTQINGKIVRAANVLSVSKTFECYGFSSTDWDAYVSGGKVIRHEVMDAYSGGWVYKVPADCIRPVKLERSNSRWEIVGQAPRGGTTQGYQMLLTDHEDAKMVYLAYVTDVASMSFEFIKCWAAKLAYEVAIALSKKAADVETLYKLFLVDYRSAVSSDISRRNLGSLIRNDNRMASSCGWDAKFNG